MIMELVVIGQSKRPVGGGSRDEAAARCTAAGRQQAETRSEGDDDNCQVIRRAGCRYGEQTERGRQGEPVGLANLEIRTHSPPKDEPNVSPSQLVGQLGATTRYGAIRWKGDEHE